jgi:hypothetical protein
MGRPPGGRLGGALGITACRSVIGHEAQLRPRTRGVVREGIFGSSCRGQSMQPGRQIIDRVAIPPAKPYVGSGVSALGPAISVYGGAPGTAVL